MKRWLAEFRVESEIKLEDGLSDFSFKHPATEFEVVIKNAPAERESKEVLSFYIFFPAETIQVAEGLAKTHLYKFLHLLSFITNTGYKMSRAVCLIDWSPGLVMRDIFAYTANLEDSAIPAVGPSLTPAISTFYDASPNTVHDRAMRWFASGVRADVMEDQFQYFWFVIELIANSSKESGKVTDKCQKCSGDLVCQSCGQISEHKPFPKQAISSWLKKMDVPESFIKDLFDVRNALMHGDTREMIENMLAGRDTQPTMELVTDAIGKIAWHSIFAHYHLQEDPGELVFFEANGYVHTKLSAKAHIQTVIPGELKIENIRLPQVSFTSKPVPSTK